MLPSPRDKWIKGVSKITKRDSTLSNESLGNIDEPDNMEVTAYLERLKKKTGVKNLWSGGKFKEYVEGNRTPDISTDSSDDNFKFNLKDIRQLALDSDEDEMRLDYMRERVDENNNSVSSDGSSLHKLMDNIQFAELERHDVQLDNYDFKLEKTDDFMPKLYVVDSEKSSTEKSSSTHCENICSLNELDTGSETSSIADASVGEISEELTNDENSVNASSSSNQTSKRSSISKRTPSLSNNHSTITNSRRSSGSTLKASSSETSQKHTSCSKSSSAMSHSKSSSAMSHSKSSSAMSHSKSSSAMSHSKSSSAMSHSNSSNSTHKMLSKSRSSRSTSRRSINKTNDTSSRLFDVEVKRISDNDFNGRNKKIRRKHSSRNSSTQTDPVVHTSRVLNFQYDWQPSSIASRCIDPHAIEALTSFNPAVLAANDMLKYHLHLMRNHIDRSRRLYEAYACHDLNDNYEYTTVESTLDFIERNHPKVITYEQALSKVKHRQRVSSNKQTNVEPT